MMRPPNSLATRILSAWIVPEAFNGLSSTWEAILSRQPLVNGDTRSNTAMRYTRALTM